MIRPAEVPLNNRLLELIAKSQRRESWRDAGGYRQHLQRQYVQWAWGGAAAYEKDQEA